MTSEVTQEAREAAIELAALLFGNGHSVTAMLKETPRHFMLDAFARFERETIARLAHRGGEVVAWMYEHPTDGVYTDTKRRFLHEGWAETPLYAAPPTDEVARLRDALEWIAANYENIHINHVDFRVEAKHRADAALGDTP